ncbi:MAG: hypothetical protein L0Z53_01850 [Acidobacteriales bacterium]|nr:hypothetical protein [Terriglobales bacterium]
MPIRDIVENERLSGRYPRIAKLHKGEPKRIKGGREIVGRDQEHFRIVFEPEFEYLMPAWENLYGAKPMEFSPVVLSAKTTDEALDFWQEEWDAAETLLHRCDGKFQQTWYDRRTGYYSKAQVACAVGECKCTPVGRMNLLFPEFIVETGVIGYISVETGSLEDIRTIRDRLRAIEASLGTLSGVHLKFGRARRRVSRPEVKNGERTGKRMKTTASMLYLLPTPEFAKNVLLPVLLGKVQPARAEIPTHLEVPTQIDTETARKLLGTGGGVRRIGNTNGEQPQTWWVDFWPKFAARALEKFDLQESQLLDALNNAVDYDVLYPLDWNDSQVVAVGAMIAYLADYDAASVGSIVAQGDFSLDARNEALAITKRYGETVEEAQS